MKLWKKILIYLSIALVLIVGGNIIKPLDSWSYAIGYILGAIGVYFGLWIGDIE